METEREEKRDKEGEKKEGVRDELIFLFRLVLGMPQWR